jgi:hypothetical protein
MKLLTALLAFLLISATANAQLWTADHEENNLSDWTKSVGSVWSGGSFPTGGSTTTGTFGLNNTVVAKLQISGAYNKTVACRLLRARDDAGKYFPKTAYYTVWMYVPKNYRTYAWWNICQFKGQRADNSTSDPIITYNLRGDGNGFTVYLYNHMVNQSYSSSVRFAAGKWVKLEALFTWDTANGTVKLWQNGSLVINKTGIKTKKTTNDRFVCWGPANYTDKISGPDGNGNATIYFDAASVRTAQVAQADNPHLKILKVEEGKTLRESNPDIDWPSPVGPAPVLADVGIRGPKRATIYKIQCGLEE